MITRRPRISSSTLTRSTYRSGTSQLSFLIIENNIKFYLCMFSLLNHIQNYIDCTLYHHYLSIKDNIHNLKLNLADIKHDFMNLLSDNWNMPFLHILEGKKKKRLIIWLFEILEYTFTLITIIIITFITGCTISSIYRTI